MILSMSASELQSCFSICKADIREFALGNTILNILKLLEVRILYDDITVNMETESSQICSVSGMSASGRIVWQNAFISVLRVQILPRPILTFILFQNKLKY